MESIHVSRLSDTVLVTNAVLDTNAGLDANAGPDANAGVDANAGLDVGAGCECHCGFDRRVSRKTQRSKEPPPFSTAATHRSRSESSEPRGIVGAAPPPHTGSRIEPDYATGNLKERCLGVESITIDWWGC